jgi:hypothetical protein
MMNQWWSYFEYYTRHHQVQIQQVSNRLSASDSLNLSRKQTSAYITQIALFIVILSNVIIIPGTREAIGWLVDLNHAEVILKNLKDF